MLRWSSQWVLRGVSYAVLLDAGGRPLLQLYCEDPEGRYRTQFETGHSGGSTNRDARRGWDTGVAKARDIPLAINQCGNLPLPLATVPLAEAERI